MNPYTQADAMSALDPFLDDLDTICRDAHARYRGYPPELLIEHDRRAEASCIYAHMRSDAERRFGDRKGVVQINLRGLYVWVIEQAVTIRFKKMDEDGRSRNYPTKQAVDYDRQRELPGLPAPPVNLVVGYLLNPTETEIERIQVARPLGRQSMDWCAALVPTSDRIVGQPRWVDVTRQARAI
jgi:hypothetical protein